MAVPLPPKGEVVLPDDAEDALERLDGMTGVVGSAVLAPDGRVLRSAGDAEVVTRAAAAAGMLLPLARRAVQDMDPEDDADVLRARTDRAELLVASGPDFTLVAVQTLPLEVGGAAGGCQ